jgi:hypothetical protein
MLIDQGESGISPASIGQKPILKNKSSYSDIKLKEAGKQAKKVDPKIS